MMVNKTIQMKHSNNDGEWDNLFPITLSENVYDEEGNNLDQKLQTIDDEKANKDDVVDKNTFNDLENLVRFTPVGENALETISSLYMPNDDNLFGRKSDGSFTNMATVQQNDILQYGDIKTDIMWLVAKNYFSFRSTGNPTYQLIDEMGNPIGPGRTIFHQGNATFHLVTFAVGTQVLTKNVYNDVTIFTNVNGVFPPDAYNNNEYTIERNGMYNFQVSAKVVEDLVGVGSNNSGSIRVSLVVNGDRKDIDDMFYNAIPNTKPFLTTTFMYRLSKGDKVSIQLNPYNEDITIGAGSKFNIYQLGDTIQE